ncbi:MAG: lycopene cyclase family protein, partial [Pseudonocardia sp.]
MYDVLVVGAGPAGRAVAAACAEHGLDTGLLDPAPNRSWRATYGAWSDELPAELPLAVIASRAQGVAVARTRRRLDREYAVLDVSALRAYLDERLAAAGVVVQQGRAVPGATPPARMVIDAGGAGQPLSQPRSRRLNRPRGRPPGEHSGSRLAAEQTAFGLMVPAELAAPVLGADEALFMDWRPVPGVHPSEWPTFLYAVPLGDGRVLMEETSLARRPGLPVAVLATRLHARLAGHGITVCTHAEREVVRFRLDMPRHRAPGVLGFGAAAPLTHPATGYQLATALRAAPQVARALAEHWADGPSAARAAAQAALWPAAARVTHVVRRRALESLLRMPPERLPEFFEGFFTLSAKGRAKLPDEKCQTTGTTST